MAMMVTPRTTTMIDLRELAETRLKQRPVVSQTALGRELELHKVELEMQNDELRRTYDDLERTRDRYRALFDAAPVAYLSVDRLGRICAANRAACELSGLSHDELVGARLAALLRSEHADQLHRCLFELVPGTTARLEADLLLRDGSCPVILDTSCSDDNFLVVLSRRPATAIVAEHQAREMAALGASTSTIVHEVNNLLHVVGASLGEVEQRVHDSSAVEAVRAGQRTLAHCKDLVSRLLTHGMPQGRRASEIVVDDFIARAVDTLRPLLGRDIRVVADLGVPTLRVSIDPIEFELVLINLASNAHDAMPSGGQLTIATRVVTRSREARFVVIIIEDTGVGMSEDVQRKIFEPFFTTKGPGAGTGLGLATSLGIVQRANGTLAVRSKPNAGTTFEITLPVHNPGGRRFALGTETTQPRLANPNDTRTSILIVEDNEAARVAMAEHLEGLGYRVVSTEEPETALAHTRVQRFDLALLDYRLRSMSGDLLARHLRELAPGLRVLLASGYPRACLHTTEPLLQKPFSLDELAAAITAALAPV